MISCSAQPHKQTRIPLDNTSAIPFSIDRETGNYYIDGFEIDEQGFFYFLSLGGEYNPEIKRSELGVYSGTKLKYRKVYNDFYPWKIYIVKNKLYVFDYMYMGGGNNIFVLNSKDGRIINKYGHIIKNQINSVEFIDTCFIAEIFNKDSVVTMKTELGFGQFDLTGKFIKKVDNCFNLPVTVYSKIIGFGRTVQLLGKWNNYYVFWEFILDDNNNLKNNHDKIFLIDKEGKKVAEVILEDKMFGKSFGGANENRKLRNDNIYILGHEGKTALITELPLKDLFHNVRPAATNLPLKEK
jgi:hypothetical protein